MRGRVGVAVLVLSALGYPLTRIVIQRGGLGGALVVQSVCSGLAARDAALVRSGLVRRLRRGPAVLLLMELGAAVAATTSGAVSILGARLRGRYASAVTTGASRTQQVAIAALFALHTIRFAIYLQPDRGLALGGESSRTVSPH
ncbi:MAG TPA: hypothetical protein VET26_09660 [Candidatus Sulfotelmatobacter sp.]|nr:hypothetical protein [Candidatus Sulfotelmatobacter sp.]